MEDDFSDFKNGKVAQQVERLVEAQCVADSTSALPTKFFKWKEIDGGFVYGKNDKAIGVIRKNMPEVL